MVNESMVTDSELLVTAFSPIRLSQSENDGNIFWLNLLAQSTRFCRPLVIEYVKDSKEKVLESINFIKTEISNLIPFKIDLSETKYVIITYCFYMSMRWKRIGLCNKYKFDAMLLYLWSYS